MKRLAAVIGLILLAVAVFVADQALRTLRTLDEVERDRDGWQRPEDIIRYLDVRPGHAVVDLGSGAGYFALKLAPRVGPDGRVLAVDVRRQSLAFLWIRARRGGHSNLQVIHGEVHDPRLPRGSVDSALIANTYHELTNPVAILKALFTSLRSGGRLVVVDRGPRQGDELPPEPGRSHAVPAADVEREIARQGFQATVREDRFIDRPQDDPWWLLVFRKP